MNTSEFARICRTERRTIHYYDSIGLLKPDHVQENGYREYSAEQVEQMDTIRILQSSGYTLKEIQKIMQAGSEARAEAFFAARDRIEERIRELQSMSDYIRKRKHQYEEFREIYPGYRIHEQQIRYDSREVKEIEEHFFSFLYDGTYDTVYAGEDTERLLCLSENGAESKSGRAITFFLRTMAESHEKLLAQVREQLNQYGFHGEPGCYLTVLPHMFTEERGIAVIRVTVFEETEK